MIIQDDKPRMEKEYLIDNGNYKNNENNNAWIILGYEKGPGDRFFFFESGTLPRLTQKWLRDNVYIPEHKVIKQSFSKENLGDLNTRIEKVFAEKRSFTFEEYLQNLVI